MVWTILAFDKESLIVEKLFIIFVNLELLFLKLFVMDSILKNN